MTTAPAELIPFGKYKGQPTVVLASDANYCDWLLGQAWFLERFPDLHTLVINNFGEPAETPEHNRLQMRFMDDDFRLRCTQAILQPDPVALYCPVPLPEFEVRGVDVQWLVKKWWIKEYIVKNDHYTDIGTQYMFEKEQRNGELEVGWYGSLEYMHYSKGGTDEEWKEIEKKRRADIQEILDDLDSRFPSHLRRDERVMVHTRVTTCDDVLFCVECKPSLGDDYPAVLRFMKSLDMRRGVTSFKRCLVIDQYQGRGATLDQVRRFFGQSDITVLTVADIEATAPLNVAEESTINVPEPYEKTA